MISEFPRIETINDVLPAIKGREEFVVKERDGYTSIDYNYALPDTFDCPIRRECRGIKFDSAGRIIGRPYHKFFNLNEKPETQHGVIPWDKYYDVLTKFDGSMVHPAIVNRELVWMTRAGVTDISEDAGKYADKHYSPEILIGFLERGYTPIFEWMSPRNRIVIPYTEDKLPLTGMRNMRTGEYMLVQMYSQFFDFPAHHKFNTIEDMLDWTKNLKDEEGYVLKWHDGFMLKIKADEYVLRHRARDDLLHEKNILRLVLEDRVDDLLPMLSQEDANRVRNYQNWVGGAINSLAYLIENAVVSAKYNEWSRKEFAINIANSLVSVLKAPAFAVWEDGSVARKSICKALLRHCGSQPEIDAIRDLLGGAKW